MHETLVLFCEVEWPFYGFHGSSLAKIVDSFVAWSFHKVTETSDIDLVRLCVCTAKIYASPMYCSFHLLDNN